MEFVNYFNNSLWNLRDDVCFKCLTGTTLTPALGLPNGKFYDLFYESDFYLIDYGMFFRKILEFEMSSGFGPYVLHLPTLPTQHN
jgi:hypothetical protein